MSFTQDELQAFNTILEQKLAVHRREMERVLEQRLQTFQREMEKYLVDLQQEALHTVPSLLFDQQHQLKNTLGTQQTDFFASLQQNLSEQNKQQRQQLDIIVENALAAQLLAVEQLIHQRLPAQAPLETGTSNQAIEAQEEFEGLEVQTELSWEDFINAIGRSIDQRCAQMLESIQALFKGTEQYVSEQLSQVHNKLDHLSPAAFYDNAANARELFESIEQLEHTFESMQVAMTANHALLSNRLSHHQHLPVERAHASAVSVNPLSPATEDQDEP